MMSVVSDVGTEMDDEREPTWDEAMAALAAATPVEVVRPPRRITVVYRYADGVFTATSPEVNGFRMTGPSLDETRRLAKDDLADFLDPAVEIVERSPAAEPRVMTAACGHGWVKAGSLPGLMVVVSSSSTGRTYVSPAKTSLRRVPA